MLSYGGVGCGVRDRGTVYPQRRLVFLPCGAGNRPTAAMALTRKFHIRQRPVMQHGRNAALSHMAPRLNA